MLPDYIKIQAGRTYRVTSKPENVKPEDFPYIGMSAKCKWTSSLGGACLSIADVDVLIPFNCLEDAESRKEMEDAYLITTMLEYPEGVLKILRGLWRMTKHPKIRELMERGELPEFDETYVNSTKTREDFNSNWDEYVRSTGALVSEC